MPPGHDDDLGGIHGDAARAGDVRGDRLAERREAGGRRVARVPVPRAATAASTMCAGVGKSGSPISRWITSRPMASRALARASTRKAASVPIRRAAVGDRHRRLLGVKGASVRQAILARVDPATEEPAPPTVPQPASGPRGPPEGRLLKACAAFLAKRGLPPQAVAASGLAFCTLAALCYVVEHPGLAGVLGLVGLLLGEIARAPATDEVPLVEAFDLLADLAIAAGYVGAAVQAESGICTLLGLLALILFAWLPYLEARSPAAMDTPARTLWRRPERLAVLLVGGLLAHPVVPLLLVVTAGLADAWLAVDRLARVGQPPRTRPAFLDALLRPDGSIQPLLRWGSLLIALLLLVVLPRAADWRF